MNAPAEPREFQSWFEAIWAARETAELPKILGEVENGIITLEQTPFLQQWSERCDNAPIHAMFGSFGVLASPPNAKRASWAYVTSGMTNPFFLEPGAEIDPEGDSGVGYELVMFAPEPQAQWPVVHLLNGMAYNLMSRSLYAHGHRRAINEPIDGGTSALTGLVFADDPALRFQLASGRGRLLTAIGVTAAELAFAKSAGTDALLARLPSRVTDPARAEVDLTGS